MLRSRETLAVVECCLAAVAATVGEAAVVVLVAAVRQAPLADLALLAAQIQASVAAQRDSKLEPGAGVADQTRVVAAARLQESSLLARPAGLELVYRSVQTYEPFCTQSDDLICPLSSILFHNRASTDNRHESVRS